MTQIILPRTEHGMDWGAKRRLLCRDAEDRKRLFIVPGYSMGMGMRGMGQTYVPAHLTLQDTGGSDGHHQWKELAKGRISNSTLREHGARIDEFFGRQVAALLDVRRSFVLTDEGLKVEEPDQTNWSDKQKALALKQSLRCRYVRIGGGKGGYVVLDPKSGERQYGRGPTSADAWAEALHCVATGERPSLEKDW